MQNQTISESYADDKKAEYCSNPTYIIKSVKNFYEKLQVKYATSKSATSVLFSKIPNRKKISNK